MDFPSLGGNWVDFVIVVILLYFLSEALRVGFWAILANFLAFLGSLLLSLRAYRATASLLRNNFSFSHSLANALGFLITAIATWGILGFILGKVATKIPTKYWRGWWSKALAVVPALGEGLVLLSFVLTLVLSLPLAPAIKKDITDSKIGGAIVRNTTGVEAKINEIFGGVIQDSLTYLTIHPGSRERIPLTGQRVGLVVDEEAEREMSGLVNGERRKRGIAELTVAGDLTTVARGHAKDMWERLYFGHISPEGEDVGDRLDEAGVEFKFAGENLALAPTVSTAHTGLMNSEGHRVNILEPKFKRIGIGVIDNGVYGKMFVQVFTD